MPEPAADAWADDFNADGLTDLAVAFRSGNLRTVFSDGKGGFVMSQTVPLSGLVDSITGADFDNDGHVDFAVTTGTKDWPVSIEIVPGAAGGQFGLPMVIPSERWGCAMAGKFSSDSKPDLALACGPNGGTVDVVLNATP